MTHFISSLWTHHVCVKKFFSWGCFIYKKDFIGWSWQYSICLFTQKAFTHSGTSSSQCVHQTFCYLLVHIHNKRMKAFVERKYPNECTPFGYVSLWFMHIVQRVVFPSDCTRYSLMEEQGFNGFTFSFENFMGHFLAEVLLSNFYRIFFYNNHDNIDLQWSLV